MVLARRPEHPTGVLHHHHHHPTSTPFLSAAFLFLAGALFLTLLTFLSFSLLKSPSPDHSTKTTRPAITIIQEQPTAKIITTTSDSHDEDYPMSPPLVLPEKSQLVVATRLHLGNAAAPPSVEKMQQQVANFANFVATSCAQALAEIIMDENKNEAPSIVAVIAVDATPKMAHFDYVAAIQDASNQLEGAIRPFVLPVTPWGKFVPALNALISFAKGECHADFILFVSAETTAPTSAITTLCQHVMTKDHIQDTLVAGALLGGHEYHNNHHDSPEKSKDNVVVELTGRTSPWNTLALWNLNKLALTGFQLVSDGLLTDDLLAPSFGIEEVMAIATLQTLLGGHEKAKAKLIQLPDVEWSQEFEDEERRKWHEQKMNSKVERASRQLDLVGLTGKVYHY